VHQVAGDHPFPYRGEVHRSLSGQNTGAGAQVGSANLLAQRRADGSLGVVLLRRGRPPDRHHGVADELLDRPAVASDHLRLVSKYRARSSRTSSPSRDSESVVNPTMSAKRTETSRLAGLNRSADAPGLEGAGRGAPAGASGAPHSPPAMFG
jgi:hypothetical protein